MPAVVPVALVTAPTVIKAFRAVASSVRPVVTSLVTTPVTLAE